MKGKVATTFNLLSTRRPQWNHRCPLRKSPRRVTGRLWQTVLRLLGVHSSVHTYTHKHTHIHSHMSSFTCLLGFVQMCQVLAQHMDLVQLMPTATAGLRSWDPRSYVPPISRVDVIPPPPSGPPCPRLVNHQISAGAHRGYCRMDVYCSAFILERCKRASRFHSMRSRRAGRVWCWMNRLSCFKCATYTTLVPTFELKLSVFDCLFLL